MGRPKGSKNKPKFTGGSDLKRSALKMLKCDCGRAVPVDADTESVVCYMCVQKRVGIDKKFLQQKSLKKKGPSGFPRGWHLYKQYVHTDGAVYSYGKEVPELKGTLPATQPKVNTLTKSQRRRIREEKKLKREQRLAKRFEKKQKKLKKGK